MSRCSRSGHAACRYPLAWSTPTGSPPSALAMLRRSRLRHTVAGSKRSWRPGPTELRGILNGIDPAVWDPARDASLESNYDLSSLDDRRPNKSALQTALGLPVEPRIPLLAMVTRLDAQKGVDLVLEALDSPRRSAVAACAPRQRGSGDRRPGPGIRCAANRAGPFRACLRPHAGTPDLRRSGCGPGAVTLRAVRSGAVDRHALRCGAACAGHRRPEGHGRSVCGRGRKGRASCSAPPRRRR